MLAARKPARGFTLIELMITLVIIGLLSSIAYPAYQDHILRTHRAAAAACLQELALQMERRYTIHLAYNQPDTNLPKATCVDPLAKRYSFGFGGAAAPTSTVPSASAPASPAAIPSASEYVLQAIPVGPQSSDTHCGTLSLDQQGMRLRSGLATDVQFCWR